MGEEREDPQKLKKIAAAAYDYESDPRWADYWSNILIPPHMASSSDVIAHFKQKFYKRFIDPDLLVDAMSSSSSSQPKRPPASSRSTNDSAGLLERQQHQQHQQQVLQLLFSGTAKPFSFLLMLGCFLWLCLQLSLGA